jgi:1,4-dihydroxy-2-naphthoate octaprenyltransferase
MKAFLTLLAMMLFAILAAFTGFAKKHEDVGKDDDDNDDDESGVGDVVVDDKISSKMLTLMDFHPSYLIL